MSDQNTVAASPLVNGATAPASTVTTTQTPDAGAVTTAATPVEAASLTAEQPFAVFPDAKAFNQRMSRETRKLMNAQAKEAGFDDWADMQEALGALRRSTPAVATTPVPEGAPETPAASPATPDEAARLKMAIQVGSKLNLPVALVGRLQGDTLKTMEEDAETLMALFQQPQRGPGIPPAPQQNKPVTFTRTQMQDAAFVREHGAEIMQAAREGRIVDS